jgi:hypothetical protein
MDSSQRHQSPGRAVTARLYETGADLQQMYGLLMEARSQTNGWRYWHVGGGSGDTIPN